MERSEIRGCVLSLSALPFAPSGLLAIKKESMAKVVHLFPDTNVLVQCRPLKDLDWSDWRQFDEVNLIISRPVQAEIDDQKNKGGDRLARRARKASSLLRQIILGGQGYSVVRPAEPNVKLCIRSTIKPSESLSEALDYSRPDDRIVGTVHAFLKQNPGADARVLTHDTGPMASAQMVGVAIAAVPDEWLLPPEPSETDKRIRSLEAEVARLKDIEPHISVMCISSDRDEKLDRLEYEVIRYEPLSEREVSLILERLKQRFPVATDFGRRERTERSVAATLRIMGGREEFTPATDEEIEGYKHKYARWLEQCEAKLRNLHDALTHKECQPGFLFAAINDGMRPANDALVTFRASGDFTIMPPPDRSGDDDDEHDDDDDGDTRKAMSPDFPSPPKPPRGTWKIVSPATIFEALTRFPRQFDMAAIAGPYTRDGLLRELRLPKPKDPNAFYYKPERPSRPAPEFSLECAQWRHGLNAETFAGNIHFPENADNIAGALECRIHAENMSETVTTQIPVRIRVKHEATLSAAEMLVDALR